MVSSSEIDPHLPRQVTHLETKVDEIKAKIEYLQKTIDKKLRLQNKNDEAHEEIKRMKDELITLQKNEKETQSQIDTLKEKLETVTLTAKTAATRAASANRKTIVANRTLSSLQQEMTESEKQSKSDIESMKNQMIQLSKVQETQQETLKQQMDKSQTEIQKCNETITDMLTRIDKRQQQQQQQQQRQKEVCSNQFQYIKQELLEIKELLKANTKDKEECKQIFSERLDKIEKRLSQNNPMVRRSSLGSERSLPSVDESILGLVGQQIGTTRQIQIRQRPQSSTGRQQGPLGASNNTQSTIAMRGHSFDNNS